MSVAKPPQHQSAFKSPWVIAIILMLVIFVGANAVMIFLAANRGPGLVVDDYYERGQDYEKNMLKRLAKDSGWVMTVEDPGFVDIGKPTVFRFKVVSKEGGEAAPDQVTLHAYRPADAKQDFSLPMQLVEPGVYEAEATFPLKGVWDVLVSAKQGEDEFNTHRRISAGVDQRWNPDL